MIKGIDVSHHNGLINWHKVKEAGVSFAYMKCSEGAFLRDKTFERNVIEADKAGIVCGAYHFFRASKSVHTQVDNFLIGSYLRNLPLQLPPVLDWEVMDEQSIATNIDSAQKILDEIEIQIRRVPMIYTSPSFFDGLKNPEQFKRYPLWLAHYTESPRVPNPWLNYLVHQKSENEKITGIDTFVDINVSPYTLEQVIHASTRP